MSRLRRTVSYFCLRGKHFAKVVDVPGRINLDPKVLQPLVQAHVTDKSSCLGKSKHL